MSGKYILDYIKYSLQVSNKGYRFSNKVLDVHLYFSLIFKKLLGTIVRRYQVILFNKRLATKMLKHWKSQES